MGSACDLMIGRLPVPVRDVKTTLSFDEHNAPGTILHIQVDMRHPLGYGMPADTYGFDLNGPFFTVVDGFTPWHTTVVARYPSTGVLASAWATGADCSAGTRRRRGH